MTPFSTMSSRSGCGNERSIASTLWRTVSDQKGKRYFFESTRSPNVFWVALDDLDFSQDAEVRRLPLTKGEIYAGDAAAAFQPAEPFAFLPADD